MKSKKAGKWFRGYLMCQTDCGSWERFMNMCRHHGIDIWKIKREEDICFCLQQKSFRKIIPIAKKTGVRPHIQKKRGFPFLINGMKKNWTFYTGFLVFLLVLSVLSTFVWEIVYKGQSSYSKETLSKTVEAMDVYPGMSRSRLDCDAIEKRIRQIHPDISWVSAEEKGSVLQISIKEGKKTIVHDAQAKAVHLLALQDGVVQEIVANRGTVAVKVGQKVKKGDILIRGIVPVTDDNSEVVENIPVAAKGQVTLFVQEEMTQKIPVVHDVKAYTGDTVSVWQFDLGGMRFSLKNPFKRLDNSMKYDIINAVCADRIIHPFPLSLFVQETQYREYKWKKERYSEQGLKQAGMKLYQKLLTTPDGKPKELVSHEAVMKKQGDTWLLHAVISYRSHEMGTKPVTKAEISVKKPDGGQDGESGNNS